MSFLSKEIKRDGTSQIKRLAETLLPEYAKIEERSEAEFLEMLYSLSKHIVYHNHANIPNGSWQDFLAEFADKDDTPGKISQWEINGNAEPHNALIITFLRLLEYANIDLNKLTEKHLGFFYEKVLRIIPGPAIPDKVHVIFELAKNYSYQKLSEGTLLDAGKDASGNPKNYKLTGDIVVNTSFIDSLRSVYLDKDHDHRLYSALVANSADGAGKAFEEENTAWKAFGESQNNLSPAEYTMANAQLGFAVSSPLLYLTAGERTITLTITCRSELNRSKNLQNDFKVYISGEKEWMPCEWLEGSLTMTGVTEIVDSSVVYYHGVLTLKVKLSTVAKSTSPFDPEIHSGGFTGKWPVLKFILDPESTDYPYLTLSNIQVISANVAVSVSGSKNMEIKNDLGNVDPSKPFHPFGPLPRPGSYFDIISTELSSKNIQSATLTIDWDNIPQESLGNYYAAYAHNVGNDSFTVQSSVLNMGTWIKKSTEDQLFDSISATEKMNLTVDTGFADQLSELLIAGNTTNNRIRFELSDLWGTDGFIVEGLRAFGHQEYANLYTDAAVLKAQATTQAEIDAILFPNPPYSPLIKEISLSYECTADITLDELKGTGLFFNIGPFGCNEIRPESKNYPLIPIIENEGNFYIGLKSLSPPQNVSILFQLAEGSGETEQEYEESEITWSYLSEEGWVELTSLEIVKETTLDLQKSGIIEFSIGSDAVKGDTRFLDADDHYWIKGSVSSDPRQVCKLIKLYANAAIAEYDNSNTAVPEITNIDENKITKLVLKNSAIKKVLQPYKSYGGQQAEQGPDYYTRVSERLRHKNRQVTNWDFERAVLEEFPDVYKVKCLRHADAVSEIAPGSLTLLIITNLRNTNAPNPLEPTTSLGRLTEIKNFAVKFISPHVNVNVENPLYEQLLVDFKVGFYEGFDGGFYGNLLNLEIKKFLSPWAYEEGKDIIFGGKVYRSDILWFVENLDYVDYVTEFKLYHIYPSPSKTGIDFMQVENDFIVRDYTGKGIEEMEIGSSFIVGYESEVAEASSPRSIMVSAENHRIEVLKTGEYSCPGNIYDGIGKMAIEINFDIE